MSRLLEYSSEVSGTATTSEVVLSIEISSLPVGGMITRIACGSTIRRIDLRRASCPARWPPRSGPVSTEVMPARTISAM